MNKNKLLICLLLFLCFTPLIWCIIVDASPNEEGLPCYVPRLLQEDLKGNLGANLKGLKPLSAFPVVTQEEPPPDTIEFHIVAGNPHTHFATLVNTTDYAYIYWEEDISVDEGKLNAASQAIDQAFMREVQSAGGDLGDIPDCDGYEKIFVYIGDLHGEGGGYFNYRDQYNLNTDPGSPDYNPYSNEKDIIYIHHGSDEDWIKGTIAHELNHMIHWWHDHDGLTAFGEEKWVSEGLATFGTFYTFGIGDPVTHAYCDKHVEWFEYLPNVSLTWTEYSSDDVINKAQYGVAYVFILYIYEKFDGVTTIRSILQDIDDGMKGIEDHLSIPFTDVFANWVIANRWDEDTTVPEYRYDNIDIQVNADEIESSPVGELLPPWAAIYHKASAFLQDEQWKVSIEADGNSHFVTPTISSPAMTDGFSAIYQERLEAPPFTLIDSLWHGVHFSQVFWALSDEVIYIIARAGDEGTGAYLLYQQEVDAIPSELLILSPTTANPISVGDKSNPNPFDIHLTIHSMEGVFIPDLVADDFRIVVGEKVARVKSVTEQDPQYIIQVETPTQTADGNYDLWVNVGVIFDVEHDAVEYKSIVDTPQIITENLPDGTVGEFYSQTLEATGGTPPYSWSISAGNLPDGLSLNESSGNISGTPTVAGQFNFTAKVTDSQSQTDTQDLSINIIAQLQIITQSLPDGTVGEPYSQTLQATGGTPPYSWSITNGNLPNGLSLNESSGEISGTPTVDDTFNFTVQVEDSEQQTDTQDLSITIIQPSLNDDAELVKHITYPDGTRIIKGTPFTKIWRLRNTGTTDWNVGYALAFDGGDQMEAPNILYLTRYVYPGETIDLSVPMQAPDSLGIYTGYFRMQNDDGQKFGERIHVQIEVIEAAILVSGDITTNTTWNEKLYIVTADVRVFDNATLTIAADVQIRFRQNTSLTFGYDDTIGNLDARGMESLPIYFVADLENPSPGYWQGIYFDANSTGVMDYCAVLHAGRQKSSFRGSSWTTALLAWKAELTLSHTQISESSNTGLYLYQQSAATISESMIDNNSGNGIALTHSDITMTNSSISNNGGTGIDVGTDTCNLSLSGNTIADNSAYGVRLYLSQASVLAGNTLINNDVRFYSGTITENITLPTNSYICYNISVTNDATLTIAAGAELRFYDKSYSLTFGDETTAGHLVAQGTKENPIQFVPDSSYWQGIYFDVNSTGVLEHCTIQKAGYEKSFHGGKYKTSLMSWQATVSLANTQIIDSPYGYGLCCYEQSEVTLDTCVVKNNSTTGIYVKNSTATIEQSTIQNNGIDGISLSSSSAVIQNCTITQNSQDGLYISGGTPTLSGNTITDNGRYVARLSANHLKELVVDNTFSTQPVLVYSGTITESFTLPSVSPYICYNISVTNDATLTIAAGAELRFYDKSYSLTFGDETTAGHLVAQGTKENPIQFVPDSSYWQGIYFDVNSTGVLEHCTIQKAGYEKSFHGGKYKTSLMSWQATVSLANTQIIDSPYGYGLCCYEQSEVTLDTCVVKNNSTTGIYVNNSTATIEQSTIQDNGSHGISISGNSGASINFNNITGHSSYGVYNSNANVIIDAQNNWWGDASGPTHPSNPTGTGDRVSDYVTFIPWLETPAGQPQIPIAPTNLVAVAFSHNQVDLSWDDNSNNELGFKIERKQGAGDFTEIATVEANRTSYSDKELEANTTYVYRVCAYNDVGDSEWSNEASVTTLTFCPYTVTPTNTSMFIYGDAQINGYDAEVGDCVAAFAPDVVINEGCIGLWRVIEVGIYGSPKVTHPQPLPRGEVTDVGAESVYGAMAVYGDDPTTPEKDGAKAGDVLSFEIYDGSEDKRWIATPLGPDAHTWENGAVRYINLNVLNEFKVHLAESWNLISFPVGTCYYQDAQPTAFTPAGTEYVDIATLGYSTMAEWFSSILTPNNGGVDPAWRQVSGFDDSGANVMDTTMPESFHTLKYMAGGYGYWVKMNEGTDGGVLTFTGARLPEDTPLSLQEGWNLIGYLPVAGYYDTNTPPVDNLVYARDFAWIQKPRPLANEVLASITGKYRYLSAARPGGAAIMFDPTIPVPDTTLRDMSPGAGYWLKMYEAAELIYNTSIQAETTIVISSDPESVYATNRSMFLYGDAQYDSVPAPVGSEVIVRTPAGLIVANGVVETAGQYGAIAVYGDDLTTPEQDGVVEGELLSVSLNGQLAHEQVHWEGEHAVFRLDLSATSITYGDVSGNDEITAYDASLVLQHVIGLIELSPDEQDIADVTGDDTVSALDAALILQYTVGLITRFPVDSPLVAPALNSKTETKLLTEAIELFDTTHLTKEQKQVLEQLKNLVFSQLIPKHTALLQNFPNPFNPETWIPFELANEAEVVIRIYNLKGQLIRTLQLGSQPAGSYLTKDRAAHWNGRNNIGQKVSSGLYFYAIHAGNFTATKRMILLK